MEQKLQAYLDEFSKIGATSEGGITRLLYDESWQEMHVFLQQRLIDSGLQVTLDSAGNVFGFVEGRDSNSIILTGSHMDTVVNGGQLDGQFGIIASLIAIENLVEAYGQPKKTLGIVAFAEEEGSRFDEPFWGSRNVTGTADKESMRTLEDREGVSFVDAMEQAGFSYDALSVAPMQHIDAFVEMHIEQGLTLEKNNAKIGLVHSIVGQKVYVGQLQGEANHAGTTAMEFRQDALVAYANIVVEATKLAQLEENLTLTFGQVTISPNVTNVIADNVQFTIDVRDPNQEVLDAFCEELEVLIQRVAAEYHVEEKIHLQSDDKVTELDQDLMGEMEQALMKQNISYVKMHSGAGHDSQQMAQVVPAGLIFVPSIGGKSHSPLEATKTEDLLRGIKVLERVLYLLAYE